MTVFASLKSLKRAVTNSNTYRLGEEVMNLAWEYWVLSMWDGIYRYSVVSSMCVCVCVCVCVHARACTRALHSWRSTKNSVLYTKWVECSSDYRSSPGQLPFEQWIRDTRHLHFAAMPMEYLVSTQQWQDRKKPEDGIFTVKCFSCHMWPL